MKDYWKKNLFSIIYGIVLAGFTIYAILDVFVIPRPVAVVDSISEDVSITATYLNTSVSSNSSENLGEESADKNVIADFSDEELSNEETINKEVVSENAVSNNESVSINALEDFDSYNGPFLNSNFTDESEFLEIGRYADDNIGIILNRYYYCNTYVFVADIYVSSPAFLKSAFANDTYGRNIKKKTTQIAADHNAILAINGDFYGARQSGYVVRNGVLFCDITNPDSQDLAIKNDGSFLIYNENECTAEDVISAGVWQAWSFGPALLVDNQISVSERQEVAHAMNSNPRTAIGEVAPGHYFFIVSDGRTNESKGLSLYQLADFMKELGCKTAYNLDGGGSSTMYFQGSLINNPCPADNIIAERSVSDIVYIGY